MIAQGSTIGGELDRNPVEAPAVYSDAQIINQIASSSEWSGAISYSFLSSAPNYAVANGWQNAYEYAGMSGFNGTQQAATRTAMEIWDDLIATSITESSANNGNADIKLANTNTNINYAHAYFPGNASWSGEVWLNSPTYSYLNTPDQDGTGNNSYAYMTILHEIGHALGLNHPGNYNGGNPTYANDALYTQDTHQWTVMSYFSATNTNADWNGGSGWGYAQTAMVDDIKAIQSMYGADTTTRTGDTTYGFNVQGLTQSHESIYNFALNDSPILTIYDAGGSNDTLDLSGFSQRAIINLNPGTYSSAGGTTSAMTYNIGIAHNTIIENAVGGSGNDVFYGNSANNTLTGNAGNDTFYDSDGNDTYNGGANTDTVYFGTALANLAFLTTGLGTYIQGVFTDLVSNDIETVSFAGSAFTYGTISQVSTPQSLVETSGSVDLVVTGAFDLYGIRTADGYARLISGPGGLTDYAGPNTYAGYQALQIEADGNGGYIILWEHTPSGALSTWTLDGNGNYLTSAGVNQADVTNLETFFNADINGDTIIGVNPNDITTVEEAGATDLEIYNPTNVYQISGPNGPTVNIIYNGQAVGPNSYPGWTATQVEWVPATGDYAVLWEHSSGTQTIWSVNADGNYLSAYGVNGDNLWATESLLQADINNDGDIGYQPTVSTTIESNGTLPLYISTDGEYFTQDPDTGNYIRFDYAGSVAGPNSYPGYTLLQVEKDTAGGYVLLWQDGSGNLNTWNTDASGTYVAFDVVNNANLEAYEYYFDADLDNDGQVGYEPTVASTVETNGSLSLFVSTDGEYYVNDPVSGKSIGFNYNGAPAGPNTYPGYILLHAEKDTAGGYVLLWQDASGNLNTWNTDANGNYVAFDVVNPANIGAYETYFGADLDGNSIVGASTADVLADHASGCECGPCCGGNRDEDGHYPGDGHNHGGMQDYDSFVAGDRVAQVGVTVDVERDDASIGTAYVGEEDAII